MGQSMNPAMLKAGGLGLIAGSSIYSAGTAHIQGQLASRFATMQAGQLDRLANQYDDAAKEEFGKGTVKAKSARKDADLLQSRIMALSAANGGVNQKSVVKNLLEVEEKGEYNSLMELYNGSSAAYELRRKADQIRGEAVVTRFEGRNARRSGNQAAIGSLLSGAGSAATFASKFNTNTNNLNTPNTSKANINLNTGGNVFANTNMPNTTLNSKY
jgi:hypothetical protein